MSTTHHRLVSRAARTKRRTLAKEIAELARLVLFSWEQGNEWSATEAWVNELRGCVEALAVLCGQPDDDLPF